MSVPTSNLYDFVHQVLENRFIVKYFFPYGSRELTNVINLFNNNSEYKEKYKNSMDIKNIFPDDVCEFFPWDIFQNRLFCHDQEPLNFDYYSNASQNLEMQDRFKILNRLYFKNLTLKTTDPDCYKKYWILLHSELNSNQVERYENLENFIGAYWWSHAIISLDWYRFAEHDERLNSKHKNIQKSFLVYALGTTGTREYRKNFLDLINKQNIINHCQIGSFDNKQVTSDSSAEYNVKDFQQTAISIVLETVFDERIHLTEKTLRPIAVGHPFIIANGPGTLAYLRNYGFKTFSPWIDESYDLEQASDTRLQMIVAEMKRLSLLPELELNTIIQECNKIAKHNQKLFFSQTFFDQIVNELKRNVLLALEKSQEQLDWKIMWEVYKHSKHRNDQEWINRKPYMLTLIRHLKKGGTLEEYVPPNLD